MAFSIALAKAKGATQYRSTDFIETNSDSTFGIEAKIEERFELVGNLFQLKKETDNLRVEIEEQRLKQDWENHLASTKILEALKSFETQLNAVINTKEACLSILRNSVSKSSDLENSLSLKRDRQAELVQAFDTLVLLKKTFLQGGKPISGVT